MKEKLPIFLIVTSICLIIVIFFLFKTLPKSQFNKNPISGLSNSFQSITPNVSPTPFPFYEMTIPHFRNRTYKSSITSQKEVTKNSIYTSYLASYNSDGLKINGLLTVPNGNMPSGGWPAIVFIHGYIPPATYRTISEAYSSYVDYLARNGFVVFKIDLRGHGDSEGESGGGYYSEGYVIDSLNAYSALENSNFVNPKKIGFWGHSMAGNIVMRVLAAKPLIPAVVIWSGAVYTYQDFMDYGLNDNSYRPPTTNSQTQRRRNQLFETYGQFSKDSVFWQQVAPTNYLSDIQGAIQLNHAVDDDVVTIKYSRNLNSILNSTQIVHELQEYPSGGHNISGASFNTAMQNTVDFFKKYLN